MADIIRLLPDSVANQIAAGEVIQRPASVIKELVENAVDAGATEIQIFIRDAGRTLIQVIDNGKGMTETDARMAFERHATSKISQADDLLTLATMGFRGEALPSICAISQVELRTKTADDSMGIRLCINGSEVETQEPCVCEQGSNFMIRNIFYNVPARRKFLKSDNVELSNIMREFERLALVNNNIRMSIDTGGRKISLMPGNFKQRITDLWKNNLNMQLLPVDVETSIVKIQGYISRPEHARKRNPLQYLIVNGRNMKHPYFRKAVLNCYEHLTAPGTEPCYFLKFEVDPSTIDVNIHPTKNEIRFEYEKEIWPILAGAVRASLGSNSAVPSIDFNSDILPVNPLKPGQEPEVPNLDIPGGYNPFDNTDTASTNPSSKPKHRGGLSSWRPAGISSNWEELYAGFMNKKADIADADNFNSTKELPGTAAEDYNSSICLQFANKYILTSSREGLLVIDQHRAHFKILYEKFLSTTVSSQHSTQRVMFPETITLDDAQQLTLEGIEDELKRMGFVIKQTGDTSWRIEGVPSMIRDVNPVDIILSMLESVSDDAVNYGKEESPQRAIRENLAMVMARCGAIKGGVRLSDSEMEHLVGQLMSLPDPVLTPYGKSIYKVLPGEKIESWLG
ncbi:MAG: DNA mismatch repair endonuclease MutL [Prevotella sp.]|nr:DNA mismatch repair endonuclease MutL [Bacteroides sp.]MCM1366163.1 DNA mismatch repair endonuclease MutL [Prevotella sp.]MCM1436772.1 DNA mismatch repair endonuclease MutL [Prevotella sp.]